MDPYNPLSDLQGFEQYPSFTAGDAQPTVPNYQPDAAHGNFAVITEEPTRGAPRGPDNDAKQGDQYDIYMQNAPAMLPGIASHDLPVMDAPPPSNLPTDAIFGLITQVMKPVADSMALIEQHYREEARIRAEIEEEQNPYTTTLLINEIPVPIGTKNRRYNMIFCSAATAITVQIPGIKPTALTPKIGWNVTNFPEGTTLQVAAGTTFGVYLWCDDNPLGPPLSN